MGGVACLQRTLKTLGFKVIWIVFMFVLVIVVYKTEIQANRRKGGQHVRSVVSAIKTQQGPVLKDSVGCRKNEAVLHLLPQSSPAKCLDGSSPAYYVRKGSGSGSTKWIVLFEGGGWCYDMEQCYLRSNTLLGSSNDYPQCMSGPLLKYYMSEEEAGNPMMYNWNTVVVRYCDGSSYAGDNTVRYKRTGKSGAAAKEETHTLFFKGKHNREQIIRSLLEEKDMKGATDIVIAGCSAGGLAMYLGMDQIADMIHSANPTAKVRGLADSGYFPEYISGDLAPLTHFLKGKDEASVSGRMDYATSMRRVFEFANITAGAHPDCVNAFSAAGKADNCIFAENLAPFIKTPTFHIQSQYDRWQLNHILGNYSMLNTSKVNHFSHELQMSMRKHVLGNNNRYGHAVFMDSCSRHCTSCWVGQEDIWAGGHIMSTNTQKKMSISAAFEQWYNTGTGTGSSSGSSSSSNNSDIAGAFVDTAGVHTSFYFQKGEYECKDCCQCRLFKAEVTLVH